MADTQQRLYHVSCSFNDDSQVSDLGHAEAMHLYRIGQEAVNNAIKHAECEHIRIHLDRDERDVTLSIADDGTGLPENPSNGEGMGLEIMRYRTRMIGGTLTVANRCEGGTIVSCTFTASKKHLDEL